ncbi:MAG: hypothetical protein IPL52_10595 [Flavobacteriales bacterium]|nr:hypothetical protein [Flavobacteriales bacterium]
MEIESALKRKIHLIPAVHGRGRPRAQDLPPELAELNFRQVVRLDTRENFEQDIRKIIKAIRKGTSHHDSVITAPSVAPSSGDADPQPT